MLTARITCLVLSSPDGCTRGDYGKGEVGAAELQMKFHLSRHVFRSFQINLQLSVNK